MSSENSMKNNSADGDDQSSDNSGDIDNEFREGKKGGVEEMDIEYTDIKFDDVTPTKQMVNEREVYSQVTLSTSGTAGFKKVATTDERAQFSAPNSDKAQSNSQSRSTPCLQYSINDGSSPHMMMHTTSFSPISPPSSCFSNHYVPPFNRKPLHFELRGLLE